LERTILTVDTAKTKNISNMAEKLITIKELGQRFNLTPCTINHYTNLGLLKVVGKKKNRRLYSEEDIKHRLAKIAELISQGYPLQLISKKLNGEGLNGEQAGESLK